jgi:hypothetical protein
VSHPSETDSHLLQGGMKMLTQWIQLCVEHGSGPECSVNGAGMRIAPLTSLNSIKRASPRAVSSASAESLLARTI